MARILTTGYESGDLLELGTIVGGNLSVVNTNPTPRFGGGYCLKCNLPNGSTNQYKQYQLPAPITELWVRLGFWTNITNGETAFLGLFDSANGGQVCVTFQGNSDFQFHLRQGWSYNGNQLAQSSLTGGYPINTWHLVELRWQASSITTGICELWINGTRVINFSGDNTATANVNVQYVGVGGNAYFTPGINAIDDLAVNDTTGTVNNARVGDGRVILLTPNAAGASTALNRGGTDTGTNYGQVSEVPPSMAQYVTSGNIGDRDLYNLTDAPTTTLAVNSIELVALAALSDVGPGQLGLVIQSGPSVSEGTAQALSSSPAYYRNRWEIDPNTGAAWTLNAVNQLQAGVTVR